MPHPEGLAIARRLIAKEAEKKTGFLDLGMLGLTELPDELFGLAHLRGLNLGRWYNLENDTFRGASNSIGSNVLPAHALESLRDLKLESLHVAEVAQSNLLAISGITSLRALDCNFTQVTDLTPLAQLANLQSLDCSGTQVNDLTPLAQLANLQSLDCYCTQVTDLTPFTGLRSLTTLDAGSCELVTFPDALLRSETSIKLRLYETKIPGIPAEVLSLGYSDDCRKSLLAHVNDLEAGEVPVADVKVIVIGNGRIGERALLGAIH